MALMMADDGLGWLELAMQSALQLVRLFQAPGPPVAAGTLAASSPMR